MPAPLMNGNRMTDVQRIEAGMQPRKPKSLEVAIARATKYYHATIVDRPPRHQAEILDDLREQISEIVAKWEAVFARDRA